MADAILARLGHRETADALEWRGRSLLELGRICLKTGRRGLGVRSGFTHAFAEWLGNIVNAFQVAYSKPRKIVLTLVECAAINDVRDTPRL